MKEYLQRYHLLVLTVFGIWACLMAGLPVHAAGGSDLEDGGVGCKTRSLETGPDVRGSHSSASSTPLPPSPQVSRATPSKSSPDASSDSPRATRSEDSLPTTSDSTPVYGYRVIAEYRHDSTAYTEGLVYEKGQLFESTGLRGISTLREVRLETGKILREESLERKYFAEGLTLWQDRLIQLTYTSGVGFVYDQATFRVLGEWSYEGEGWGLTHDDNTLLMSDGSAWIRRLDPETFEEIDRFEVTDQGVPVSELNELEYINGQLWANVFLTDRIVIISPDSGQVQAWIDLTGLLSESDDVPWSGVLNGIAYDSERDRVFVTGKSWPRLYHIELVPPEPTR